MMGTMEGAVRKTHTQTHIFKKVSINLHALCQQPDFGRYLTLEGNLTQHDYNQQEVLETLFYKHCLMQSVYFNCPVITWPLCWSLDYASKAACQPFHLSRKTEVEMEQ